MNIIKIKQCLASARFLAVVLVLTFATGLFGKGAEAATQGTVVTVDGISGLLTAVDPLYVPSNATSYLYDAMDADWRFQLTDQIGPVQPFYWGGNLYTQTDAAVESLSGILKQISDNNKATNAPLVVISHSWGTVLTYMVLQKHPEIVVDKLITMGSPLESIVPGVNTITKPALALNGILTINPLPNIKIWHNYWASCDPVSNKISAAQNHQYDWPLLAGSVFCHSRYFEDASAWAEILLDAQNTEWPLKISVSPTAAPAPAVITFQATGSLLKNGVTYAWDFGDSQDTQVGTHSLEQHFYRQTGSYNVKLTMTDGGVAHEVTKSIPVYQHPISLQYLDGTERFSMKFSTDSSTYIKNYYWNYGDGSPAESGHSLTSVTHDYPSTASGCYTTRLTMTLDDDSTIQSEQYFCVGPGTRYIQGHQIYGNETWHSGGTYVVQGRIEVLQGATLTIEPGAIVKFGTNSWINVSGTLIANGTADKKIVFTHITDDSYGGDTNGDGSASHPGRYKDSKGDWQSNLWYALIFDSESINSLLNYAIIRNAGVYLYNVNDIGLAGAIHIESSSVAVSNTVISNNYNKGVSIRDSSPTIRDNTISNNGATGIKISSGSPIITGNTVTGIGSDIAIIDGDIGIFITGIDSLPSITGNTISNSQYAIYSDNIVSISAVGQNIATGNQVNGIHVSGTQLTANANWKSNLTYVVDGYSTIPAGITLMIGPGTIIKFRYNSGIDVFGTLVAIGTNSKKIIFTHLTDDSYGGDTNGDGNSSHPGVYQDSSNVRNNNVWGGLYFGNTSLNSIIDNSIIKNVGYSRAYVGGYTVPTSPIRINTSSFTVSNSVIGDNYAEGIVVESSSPMIRDNIISNNDSGISIKSGNPTITGNTITAGYKSSGVGIDLGGNPGISGNSITGYSIGIYCHGGSSVPIVYNNTIRANSEYGLANISYDRCPNINAANNNWGDPSGPLDDSDDRASGGLYNPNGRGNKVSDHVNYFPWTNSAVGATAVPTGLAGAPGSYALNLKWTANAEADLGGYKIYYGTASGVYGTSNMVGNLTTTRITGLSNGTPYFVAIASMNSVGVESAKSAEIVITPIYDATKPTDGTLTAVPGNLRVTLSWTPATDAGTGLSIISPYKLVKDQGSTAPGSCSGTSVYQGSGLTFTDTGLAAGQAYAYRLCAYDNAANESIGATAMALVPVAGALSYPALLAPGWNLLGNSLTQTLPVATLYGDPAVVNTVWKWDVSNAGWQFYTPSLDAIALQTYAISKGYGVLNVINPGEGYWVSAKQAASLGSQTGVTFALTAASLHDGWNLVATGNDVSPSAFNLSLSATPPVQGSIPLNLTSLWAWSNLASQWYFYASSLEATGGLGAYTAGKGYLDFTTNNKTLGAGTGFWVNRP